MFILVLPAMGIVWRFRRCLPLGVKLTDDPSFYSHNLSNIWWLYYSCGHMGWVISLFSQSLWVFRFRNYVAVLCNYIYDSFIFSWNWYTLGDGNNVLQIVALGNSFKEKEFLKIQDLLRKKNTW